MPRPREHIPTHVGQEIRHVLFQVATLFSCSHAKEQTLKCRQSKRWQLVPKILLASFGSDGANDCNPHSLQPGLGKFRKRRTLNSLFLKLLLSPLVLGYSKPSHELAYCLAPRRDVVITKDDIVSWIGFFEDVTNGFLKCPTHFSQGFAKVMLQLPSGRIPAVGRKANDEASVAIFRLWQFLNYF